MGRSAVMVGKGVKARLRLRLFGIEAAQMILSVRVLRVI
jgi:hypothetical protein